MIFDGLGNREQTQNLGICNSKTHEKYPRNPYKIENQLSLCLNLSQNGPGAKFHEAMTFGD